MGNVCAERAYIRRAVPKDQAYDIWLSQLDSMEHCAISACLEGSKCDVYGITFRLFPLIESISTNLLGAGSRRYLNTLGYSDEYADLMIEMFRNGHAHIGRSYRLQYRDGVMKWSIGAPGDERGFGVYNAGYASEEFPEENIAPETALHIYESGNTAFAHLDIDVLARQIRYDLKNRKNSDNSKTIEIIIGQESKKLRPKAEKKPKY